jgi:hypothetical protein
MSISVESLALLNSRVSWTKRSFIKTSSQLSGCPSQFWTKIRSSTDFRANDRNPCQPAGSTDLPDRRLSTHRASPTPRRSPRFKTPVVPPISNRTRGISLQRLRRCQS